MIQVQVIYGSQALEVQGGVNTWLKNYSDKVTILRIGDAIPKGDNGAYLTIVYTTSSEDVFDKEIPE
jgi:hypothetical protein